jgi:protein TonB
MGVEGEVALMLTIDVGGRVTDARVIRSAGHGFDESALRAARRLRFAPARKGGAAVPVRIVWTCRFQLED